MSKSQPPKGGAPSSRFKVRLVLTKLPSAIMFVRAKLEMK
jgi:hypothetical protein